MGAELFENILGEGDIETLFTDPEEPTTEEPEVEEEPQNPEEPETKNTETKTTEVDSEDLFDEEQPESVGSGKDKEDKDTGGTSTEEDGGTSPKQNFYSSIAEACAVDGIFPNLDEETLKAIDSAEAFSDAIEAEVNARLDEKQQRVAKALDNGVEASDIRKYENTINYVNSITDAQLSDESEQGEQLRYNIIFQDFLNRGYSQDKAKKYTQRTIDAGTDVEDAKEALQSNKEYFQEKYRELLEEAQKQADADKEADKKKIEKLKTSLLKDEKVFGDMEVSSEQRKKTLDNISKPVYKDPETGEYLTALQKYEVEHPTEFLKYAGLIFTLTKGFTDFESFVKGKVKKEVKKGLRDLEQTLSNTRRNSDGSLKMVTGAKEDPESYLGKGVKLDI